MGSKCCKPEDKIYSDVARINEQQQQYRPFSPYTLTPVPLINNHNDISARKRKQENDPDDDYDDKGEKVGESSNKRPIAAKRSAHRSSVRSLERTIMEVLPEFVKPLGEYSFKVNAKGKLSVTVQSHSEYKVTWFRNGKKLDPALDLRYQAAVENDTHSLNLLQVHLEDEGRWTCVAENIVGKQTTHGVVKLMIPRAYKPPEFVEPLRAILTEAGTVSLECKVTGIPTPVLQWFKDGEPIKPGDVFALKQADPTSLGSYTCQATNCMGTAVSCSHVHVTSSRPAIMDGLVDHKARIGEPHVLTVGVRNPVGKVIWYNKGVEVKEDSRIQVVQNDYSVELVLNPLMLCDDGEWKCSVNGVETNCFLSVVAPKNYRKPRFLQDLKAVLTEEGLVTFECKVVGYPTPELKWFKDGVELKPGDVYQLCGSNSLGLYTCIASNCMGVSESTAELTFDDIQFQLSDEERGKLLEHLSSVNRPPQFVRGLKSATVLVGSKLELAVELNCKATLEWYFENQLIQPGEEYTITGNSLLSEALPIGKEGEYKCVAKNEYGTSFSCCRISLNVPSTYKKPRFLEGLRAVLHEGIVNLECKVIGVPQPTLKWFKDGVELKAGDIHKIVSSGGNCCLGTYTCQARNCMGTCESSASLLGFEETKKQEDILEKFARDPSLSTILEERSSQMVSVYETAEGLDEISVSIDGKEVSVSLYETPDLTEQDAKNIIEMFADEYSEHISEHNVLTLPSLRFVKETTNSGRIVMEAVVIDVDVEGFETPPSRHDSESEKTEADFEDITDLSESRHELLEDFEAFQVGAAVELVLEKEKTMTSLESPTDINTVVSSGLKMLEIPENDDFRIVEPDDSSSPEVSFYSEGLETPVFGSMEALPQKIEDDWEIVGNREITEGFNETIDEFGGKINEFLNELNKLTGAETDQINIFDSNELEPVPEILQDGQPQLIVPEKETAMKESTNEQQKSERKDSMTQTAHTVKSMAENNKKTNLQQQDSNEGFEIIEHSDIVDESQKKSTEQQQQQEAQKQNKTMNDNGSATTPVEKIKKGDDIGDKSQSPTDASLVTQQISTTGTDDQSQAPAVQQTPKIADNDIFGTDNSASSIKTHQEQDTADGSKKPEQQSLVTKDDNSIDQLKPKQVNESEQQDDSKQAQEKQEKKPTSQASQTVNIQQVTEAGQATATAGDKVQNVATAQEVQQQQSLQTTETQQSVTSSAQASQSISTGQKEVVTTADVVTLEAAGLDVVNGVTKTEAGQAINQTLSAAVSTEATSMTAETKALVSTVAEAQTAKANADSLVTTDSLAKIASEQILQKEASAEAAVTAEDASETTKLSETVQAQSAVTTSETGDRALQTQNADVRVSKQEEGKKADDQAKENASPKLSKEGKEMATESQAKSEKSPSANETTADFASDIKNAVSAAAAQQLALAATTEAQVTVEAVDTFNNSTETKTTKVSVTDQASEKAQVTTQESKQGASAPVTSKDEKTSSDDQSTKQNAAESEAIEEKQLQKTERTQKRVQFAETQNSSYETASEMSEISDTAAKAQNQQEMAVREAAAGQVSVVTAENASTLEAQNPKLSEGKVAHELKSQTAASSEVVEPQESVGTIKSGTDDTQKAKTAELDAVTANAAAASEAVTVLQSGKVTSADTVSQEAQALVESSTTQQQAATAVASEEFKSASAITATASQEAAQALSGAEAASTQAKVVLQGTEGAVTTTVQETLTESGTVAALTEHAAEVTAESLIQAATATEVSALQAVGQVSSKPASTVQGLITVDSTKIQIGAESEDAASASVATVATSEAIQAVTAQVSETVSAKGTATEVEARSQAATASQDGSAEQANGLTKTPGLTAQANASQDGSAEQANGLTKTPGPTAQANASQDGSAEQANGLTKIPGLAAQANAEISSDVPLETVQVLGAEPADKVQADNSVQKTNLQAATATIATAKEAQKVEAPKDAQKPTTQEATALETVTAEVPKALAIQGSGEGLSATSSQDQLAGTTGETQPTESVQAMPSVTEETLKTAAVSATVKAQESTAQIQKITETTTAKAAETLAEGNVAASVTDVSVQESATETVDTATAKVQATVSGEVDKVLNAAATTAITPQSSTVENAKKEDLKANVAASAEEQKVHDATVAAATAVLESVSQDTCAETTKVQAAATVEQQNALAAAAVAGVTIQETSTEIQSINASANIRLNSGASDETAKALETAATIVKGGSAAPAEALETAATIVKGGSAAPVEALETAATTVKGSSAAPTEAPSSESTVPEGTKPEKAAAEETVAKKNSEQVAQALQQANVAVQGNKDEATAPLQGIQAITGENAEEIKQDQFASAVVKKVKKIVLESGDSISKKSEATNEQATDKKPIDEREVNVKTSTEQQPGTQTAEGDLGGKDVNKAESGRGHETVETGQGKAQEGKKAANAAAGKVNDSSGSVDATKDGTEAEKTQKTDRTTAAEQATSETKTQSDKQGDKPTAGATPSTEEAKAEKLQAPAEVPSKATESEGKLQEDAEKSGKNDGVKPADKLKGKQIKKSSIEEALKTTEELSKASEGTKGTTEAVKQSSEVKSDDIAKTNLKDKEKDSHPAQVETESKEISEDAKKPSDEKPASNDKKEAKEPVDGKQPSESQKSEKQDKPSDTAQDSKEVPTAPPRRKSKAEKAITEKGKPVEAETPGDGQKPINQAEVKATDRKTDEIQDAKKDGTSKSEKAESGREPEQTVAKQDDKAVPKSEDSEASKGKETSSSQKAAIETENKELRQDGEKQTEKLSLTTDKKQKVTSDSEQSLDVAEKASSEKGKPTPEQTKLGSTVMETDTEKSIQEPKGQEKQTAINGKSKEADNLTETKQTEAKSTAEEKLKIIKKGEEQTDTTGKQPSSDNNANADPAEPKDVSLPDKVDKKSDQASKKRKSIDKPKSEEPTQKGASETKPGQDSTAQPQVATDSTSADAQQSRAPGSPPNAEDGREVQASSDTSTAENIVVDKDGKKVINVNLTKIKQEPLASFEDVVADAKATQQGSEEQGSDTKKSEKTQKSVDTVQEEKKKTSEEKKVNQSEVTKQSVEQKKEGEDKHVKEGTEEVETKAEKKVKTNVEEKAKMEQEKKLNEEAETDKKNKEEAQAKKGKDEGVKKTKAEADKAKTEEEQKAKGEAEKKKADEDKKAKEETESKKMEEEKQTKDTEAKKAEEEKVNNLAQKKKEEEEKKAKAAEEEKAKEKAEKEKKAKEEVEKKKNMDEENKAKEVAEKKKAEQEKKAKEEAEKKKVEEENKTKEDAEKKKIQEDERAKEEAEKKKKAEEKKAKEEAEKKKMEEEKKAKAESEKNKKAEEEKKDKEEAEKKKAKEEAEKKKLEEEKKEAEEKKKAEDEKKAKEEAEKKKLEEEKKEAEEKKKAEDEKKVKEEAEKKKKLDEEKKAKEEAEKKKKIEEEKKAKEDAEKKVKVEEEKKAKEEAEKKATVEAEKKAKEEAEKKKAEEEKKAKVEEEKKAKEETEKKKKAEEEKKVKEEAEKKKKTEAEMKAKVEAEKKKKAEEEKKVKEEAEKKKKAEEEKKAKVEAEKKKAEDEKKAKEETEKKKKAEEEKKAKEEAEKKKADDEKKAKEETEKKKKAEEEKKAKEEAEKKKADDEKKAKEDAEKKKKDEAQKVKVAEEEKKSQESAKKKPQEENKEKDDDKKASTETDPKDANNKTSDDSTKAVTEEGPKKPKRLSSKKKKDAVADTADADEGKSSDGITSKSREGSVKKTKEGTTKKSTKKQTPSGDTADQVEGKQQTETLTETSATTSEAAELTLKSEGKHIAETVPSRTEDGAPQIRTTDTSSAEQIASSQTDEKRDGTRLRTRERRSEAASPPPTQSADRVSTAKDDASPRQRQTDKYATESDNPPSYVPRRRKLDSAETEVSDFSNSSVSRRHLRCDESYEGDSVSERSRSPSSYKYDNLSATRDYSESKFGYSRRADTGISSASSVTSTSYNREYKDFVSAHSASSYRGVDTHSSSSKRFHDDRATHSKWEKPSRLGQATSSAYSMRDLSVTDYSYKYRQPSRSPAPDESGNRAHIPKWDSKSVFGLEEARDYMKSLGYYSAIDEHDSSLAGVDDLPVDSSHGYSAISRRRPRFTIRLLDRVVSTGAILSINCSATGTPLPNLEWYRNGYPVVPDSRVKIIGGVGFGSIEVRGVEKSDQAEYSCVAVNSFGRARTSATIHVFDLNYTKPTAPVLFYSQMITETRTANEIVLETFVKGHEELNWYKDDVPLSGPNYHSQTLADGRCRLTIRNPRSSDSGSYRITGRNHFSVNSLSKYISIDDFSITGFRLPVFIKGLSDLNVEIGDSLFLSVTVEGAETVEFYKNGRLRETKMNRIGCYSTFIPFVQVEDLGVYVAVARNRYGNVESCCMLRAMGGHASIMPSFVVRPKPVYIVDVGVDLNIVVQVEGEPTPFVNWYKGCKNMILENARAMRETLSPCSIRFTLRKLTVSDAGMYTLKAKNLIGEDVTQFYVQVRETRARSLTPVSSLNERRSSLASRNRHWASVERLARSYRNSALQSYSYSSLTTRDRGSTPRMIQENSVSVQEILPGWVSIHWSRVRGRIAGYYVHCKDLSDENSDWIQLAFTRVCSHEANLLPGRDFVFRITPKCKSMEDEFSMLSDPFFLSNRVIPEFTQLLPVSTVGFVGSVYTLRCQVREGVPCSIQWFRDGEPVDSNEGSNYRSSFKNQVAELEFTVGDGDSGRYCCEAKNNFGRSISYSHFQTTTTHQNVIPCNLEDVEYPVILMEPKNRIVKNGCNAVVSCQVSPEKCNIEWIFNGEPIRDEDRNYKLTNNGKFYSLEINSVSTKLSGLYTFRASNAAGSCSSQFSIHCVEDEMDLKPRFLNQPTNLRVNPGEKFTLHGFVMGAGILFYTWKKDGRTIHRNRYKCYITEHEQNHASLTVVKPLVEHSGRYECTVYNSYGEDTIRFNVAVEPLQKTSPSKNPATKLQFKRRPEPIEIIEGDSTVLEFECAGDTGDDVQYKWYKDGLNVKDTKDAPHFTLENMGSIYRLFIRDAKMQFSGAYKLMVRSGPSSITGVTSVQVMCKSSPDPVIDIKCPAVTKPVITKDMDKVQCNYKDRVELTVEFQSNSENFYIHWDVDGIVTTGENYSSIVIPSVETSMPVSMRVFNSVGFASSQGYVSISDSSPAYGKRRIIPTGGKTMTNLTGRQLPRFYTHLHDKTVSVVDRKALLQVSIKCNNLTRTKWFKDNEELVNNSKYVVREDGDLQSLEILNLNLFDCGIYSVNIENRAGSNASSCYLHVS